ncbi:MAG: RpiB/LacA/LacB family sugar-phosphate isomerase [Candidatus Moraniibacteriota bacterium]|nr:MAG: RpiB/LacA/LacB family sugar-phosphate isomerase [Candidatus Moranbacteria bacterium]
MKKEDKILKRRPEYRTIFIGSDHAGYEYAHRLIQDLKKKGYQVIDCIVGEKSKTDDYPDRVFDLYRAMARENFSGEGILFCSSGEGVCISANKLPGIRAVEARDSLEARKSKEHNNANVLCLGAKELSYEESFELAMEWLLAVFSEETRHERRCEKIQRLEYASFVYKSRQMPKQHIIPAILSSRYHEISEKLHTLYGLVQWVQIDVIDDSNVSGRTVLPFEMNLLEWPFLFEAHLMVANPMKYIDTCKHAGFSRIIFHHEVEEDSELIINAIHSAGMEVGIAINPKTPLVTLEPFIKKIDRILLLGVHPGKSGQILFPETRERIKILRKKIYRNPSLFVDGGVNEKNIMSIVNAGADGVCVSSALFEGRKDADIAKRLQYLESFFENNENI